MLHNGHSVFSFLNCYDFSCKECWTVYNGHLFALHDYAHGSSQLYACGQCFLDFPILHMGYCVVVCIAYHKEFSTQLYHPANLDYIWRSVCSTIKVLLLLSWGYFTFIFCITIILLQSGDITDETLQEKIIIICCAAI